MITLKNRSRLLKYLESQGVQMPDEWSDDSAKFEDWINSHAQVKEWFDSQGIRAVVVKDSSAMVLVFADDVQESMFTMSHLPEIQNQEINPWEDAISKSLAKMLDQAVRDIDAARATTDGFAIPWDKTGASDEAYDRAVRDQIWGRAPSVTIPDFLKDDDDFISKFYD